MSRSPGLGGGRRGKGRHGGRAQLANVHIAAQNQHRLQGEVTDEDSQNNSSYRANSLRPYDSSGKFRRVSERGNCYFTIFIDARSRGKALIVHGKRIHKPAVCLKFIQEIRRHPQCHPSALIR